MLFSAFRKPKMVTPDAALPGRPAAITQPGVHHVFGTPMAADWPGMEQLVVALGCFWGAERAFWSPRGGGAEGIVSTSVGYAGGFTPHPTYQEICSGQTGHTEVVQIVWDPRETSLARILQIFWEGHDPTQGHRQGNDVGTQYRSAIYWTDPAQRDAVMQSRAQFQAALTEAKLGEITTELAAAGEYFFAEEHHQQYLSKNPGGYCGLGGTGVSCPVGVGVEG